MDHTKEDFTEPANLSTSITIDADRVLPQASSGQTAPHSLDVPHRGHNKHTTVDSAGNSTKSNNSSINNILPCYDFSDALKHKRAEEPQSYTDKSYIPRSSANDSYSVRRSNFSQFKERMTAAPYSSSNEKPPLRTTARPSANQSEVSRGLSALHSRVDEILRKRSLSRDLDESTRTERITEKSYRASSIDSRSRREAKPVQPYNLASISRELPREIQREVQREVPRERVSADPYLNSLRMSHSIDVSPVKPLEGLESRSGLYNEPREAGSPSRSILKDSSIGKEKTPSPTRGRKEVKFGADMISLINNRHHDSPREQEKRTVQPYITTSLRKQATPIYEEKPSRMNASFDQGALNKPTKYDAQKLDAIISRIKERNSVSPSPAQRSSYTTSETDAYRKSSINYSQHLLPSSNKSPEHVTIRREVRTEEKPYTSSNWRRSSLTKEVEKSFDEPQNDRTGFSSNGHSSFLDMFEKKKDDVSPRFNTEEDDNPRMNMHRPSKVTTEGPGSQLYAKKPAAAAGYGRSEKGYLSNFPSTIRDMPDILKNIQIGNPVKIKDFSKETAELLKKAEPVPEKAKASRGVTSDQKERYVEPLRVPHTSNQDEEKTRRRPTVEAPIQSIVLEKNSTKHYCGDVESDIDSKVDPSTKRGLKAEGSLTSVEQNVQDKKETNDAKVSSLEKLGKKAESTTEIEALAQNSRLLNDQYKEYLKAKKQKSPSRSENPSESRLSTENDQNYPRAGSFTRVCAEICGSPVHRIEDEASQANESMLSVKQAETIGETKSVTKDKLKERLQLRMKECVRVDLDASAIKEKYLNNEEEISDFDFDRNRAEISEADQSKGNAQDFKIKICKFEQDNEEKKTLKPVETKLTNFGSFGKINERLPTKMEGTGTKGY